MGLSLMRGVPSRTKFPWPAQSTPARGLIAVPALPTQSDKVEVNTYHVRDRFRCLQRKVNIALHILQNPYPEIAPHCQR